MEKRERSRTRTLLLKAKTELEEALTNRLLLIEHELTQAESEIVERLRNLEDIEDLEESVRYLPLNVTVDDRYVVERLKPVNVDSVALCDEQLYETLIEDSEEIDNDVEIIEEHYVGKKMLEKLGISAW